MDGAHFDYFVSHDVLFWDEGTMSKGKEDDAQKYYIEAATDCKLVQCEQNDDGAILCPQGHSKKKPKYKTIKLWIKWYGSPVKTW